MTSVVLDSGAATTDQPDDVDVGYVWFASCLVCGLVGGPDSESDLARLATMASGWQCRQCGGADACFVPALGPVSLVRSWPQ